MDRLDVNGYFFWGSRDAPTILTFRKEINHRGHGDERRE